MRPLRIEMEGFTTFRDPTVVDFAGADLFALTGATGSGKTSVVDAICFALYGCVPRYDDRRLVAPVISQGRNEARVRLDFAIGPDTYTAVRVVRRTRTGATTKEARLETAGGEVRAGTEKELGAAVEELLGLRYEHFTTCVVLPQGEFARFLHDKPERRQELLVELLDLGLYDRMAGLARERSALAKAELQFLERRLDHLAEATPAALEATSQRAERLGDLLAAVDRELPRLAELAHRAQEVKRRSSEATAWVMQLGDLELPGGLTELGAALDRATAELDEARRSEEAAAQATGEHEERLKALPSRPALEWALHAHETSGKLRAEQAALRQRVLAAVEAEEGAEAAVAEAQIAVEAAVADVTRIEAQHRAHAVVADLVAGERCPVCRQPVVELPAVDPPHDLTTARQARTAADDRLDETRRLRDDARRQRARLDDRLTALAEQLEEMAPALVEHPDGQAVSRALAEHHTVDQQLEKARQAERAARRRRSEAEVSLEGLRRAEVEARAAYDDVRDRFAPLGPPARTRHLVDDWRAIVEWAGAETRRQAAVVLESSVLCEQLEAEREAGVDALARQAATLGVEMDQDSPRDPVVQALTRAEAERDRLATALAEAEQVRTDLAQLTERAEVAAALGRHLGAKGFEKWILDEALGLLVDGASAILHGLSRGQYSLAVDERSSNFSVVDHRNADEHRSVRTLSGGETFLASLALALALADQVVLLAANGSARLESMFLDEGFGTLDAETLDTVASAIEELGSAGRIVGLISHVPELAERVPVRFEIAKGPLSSTVTRVDT